MTRYRRFAAAGFLLAAVAVCAVASDAQVEDMPDYSRMMLLNGLVPGTAQFALGQPEEGLVYAASLPLTLVGTGMMVYYVAAERGGLRYYVREQADGTHLFEYASPERDPRSRWLFVTGTAFTLYGTLLGAYSEYAAHRDYVDRYGSRLGVDGARSGRDSLPSLLASPYLPRNVLNAEVLPLLFLSVFGSVRPSDLFAVGDYFRRDRVPFLGWSVSPWAGLGLRLATAWMLVTANATWEEVAFRGTSLERSGVWVSSVSFGTAHLGNMILPEVSVEETLLQSLFATGFGVYTAAMTARNDYRLERAVAAHFWNNIIALTLAYLVEPDAPLVLSVRRRL
jgi:hypothetical protein